MTRAAKHSRSRIRCRPLATPVFWLSLGAAATLIVPLGSDAAVVSATSGRTTAPEASEETSKTFSYYSIVYKIPTQYLSPPYGEAPVLSVTYPEFQPAHLHNCETWFVSEFRHTCAQFDFIVSGPDGPSRRQMAHNSQIGPKIRTQKIDEYGYTVSWSRNNLSLLQFTRDNGQTFLFFYCTAQLDVQKQYDGVCSDILRLSDGDSVSFLFPYRLRGQLASIESRIIELMTTFRVK